jgi:hypothetical protein
MWRVEKLRPLAAMWPQKGANLQAIFNKILMANPASSVALSLANPATQARMFGRCHGHSQHAPVVRA